MRRWKCGHLAPLCVHLLRPPGFGLTQKGALSSGTLLCPAAQGERAVLRRPGQRAGERVPSRPAGRGHCRASPLIQCDPCPGSDRRLFPSCCHLVPSTKKPGDFEKTSSLSNMPLKMGKGWRHPTNQDHLRSAHLQNRYPEKERRSFLLISLLSPGSAQPPAHFRQLPQNTAAARTWAQTLYLK